MRRVSAGGPCNHCGRSQTPCWRRGPPEKPCLCNACGARWLVKHSLDGYMPGPSRQPSNSATEKGVHARLPPGFPPPSHNNQRLPLKRKSTRLQIGDTGLEAHQGPSGSLQLDPAVDAELPVAHRTEPSGSERSERASLISLFKEDLSRDVIQGTEHQRAEAASALGLFCRSASDKFQGSEERPGRRPRKQARPEACV